VLAYLGAEAVRARLARDRQWRRVAASVR
jgi:hypothetical protein